MISKVRHYFFRSSKKSFCTWNKRLARRREEIMKRIATAMLAGAALSLALSAHAFADGKVIGVSWSNFQEERWQTDEAAMRARSKPQETPTSRPTRSLLQPSS